MRVDSAEYEVPDRAQLVFLDGALEVISEELANHVDTIFHQPTEPIHPIRLPLTLVEPTIAPIVLP